MRPNKTVIKTIEITNNNVESNNQDNSKVKIATSGLERKNRSEGNKTMYGKRA